MAAPDQVISSTVRYFLPMVADNFFKGSSFQMRLKSHPGAKKPSGGRQIVEPILAFGPNSDWFTGDEPYAAGDNQELSNATYEWKFVRATPMITKPDLFKNSGEAAKVSLVRTKMEAASMQLTEQFLQAAFALGTAPIANAVTPIEQIVKNSNTYAVGGISSDDVTRWAGNQQDNSGAALSAGLGNVQKLYYACSEGAKEPTDFIMDKGGFGSLAGALLTNQRYLDRNADAGFTNYTFNKAIVHFDGHVQTSGGDYTNLRAYMLNLDFLRMYMGEGLDFAMEEKAPAGQSVYTWEVVLATQLTTNARWAQGVFHNFT